MGCHEIQSSNQRFLILGEGLEVGVCDLEHTVYRFHKRDSHSGLLPIDEPMVCVIKVDHSFPTQIILHSSNSNKFIGMVVCEVPRHVVTFD